MNQDESVALWRRGKEAWNAWAEDMLRQKAELEKAGAWNGDKTPAQWSDETRKWNEAAEINLSRLLFKTRAHGDTAEKQVGQPEKGSPPAVKTLIIEDDGIDFNGFVFPWQAGFLGTQFHGYADFKEAQFHGKASFDGAHFHGVADFGAVRFQGKGGFWCAQFHVIAGFWGAQFHGEALFREVQFHGAAYFVVARFRGEAYFASGIVRSFV